MQEQLGLPLLSTLPGNGPPHRDHTGSLHTLPREWPTSWRPHGVCTHPALGMAHLMETTRGLYTPSPGNGPPHGDHTRSVHTQPWEWPTSPRPHGVSIHPAEFFTRCLYPWVAHHPGLNSLLHLRESLTWPLINFWLNCIPFLLDCYITWTYVTLLIIFRGSPG